MTDDPLTPLLARVAQQDRASFGALYRAASSKLFGVLLRILGNRSDAEDALQELFTRIWLRADQFEPEKGRAMSWMIAMARNLAIDRLRQRRETQTEEGQAEALHDPTPTAEGALVARGEARRIIDCLDTLEPDRAQAVRGAYLDGLSYHDLAARHDLPLNTLRTWLRRGLLSLKTCMEG